jgi:hypothetical protein
MAKARMAGSGWHRQSVRHSNARKLGRAGGTYSNSRTPVSDFFKDMSREDIRNLRDDLKYGKDSDGDGVPDHKDCQPHNPNAQGTYELEARYDARASFYGKARVEVNEATGDKALISYSTRVAEIKDGKPIVYGTYSQTTMRHIKEFLKQEGFKAENQAQIIKDYSAERKEEENESFLSREGAEERYRQEIAEGTINTADTPHYDSLNEYIRMLEDAGFEIEDE